MVCQERGQPPDDRLDPSSSLVPFVESVPENPILAGRFIGQGGGQPGLADARHASDNGHMPIAHEIGKVAISAPRPTNPRVSGMRSNSTSGGSSGAGADMWIAV